MLFLPAERAAVDSSHLFLIALYPRETNQPFSLTDREGWEAQMYLFEAIAEVVAVGYRIGQNASTDYYRLSRYFAEKALDYLALRPVDIRIYLEIWPHLALAE